MEKELDKVEFNKIKELYIEPVISLVKLIVMLSMPLGFLYLLSFTSANNIPMPLSLSELPALLMSVFFLGSWVAIILTGFAFLPIASNHWLLGDKNGKKVFSKKDDKNTVKFIFMMGLPLIFVFLGVILASSQKFDNLIVYVVVFSISICSFVYGIFVFYHEERLKIAGILLFFFLISFYWIFLGLVFLFALTSEYWVEISNFWVGISNFWGYFIFFVFSIFMVILLFLMIVPFKNKNPVPRSFWIGIGAMIIMLPPVIDPAAVKLTEFSLKFMKLGGGYQTQIMFDEPYSRKVPPHFIDPNLPERSVTLYVVLDIGKRIYVKLNESTLVYSLPSEVMTTRIFGIETNTK